eukprot:5188589-Prymnesium_polylepis.1
MSGCQRVAAGACSTRLPWVWVHCASIEEKVPRTPRVRAGPEPRRGEPCMYPPVSSSKWTVQFAMTQSVVHNAKMYNCMTQYGFTDDA